MKSVEPKQLGDAIGNVLIQLGIGSRLQQFEVLDLWAEIVGEQIARISQAERIDVMGKLYVHVARAPWRNELSMMKRDLIKKINHRMKNDVVKEIIFR